MTEQKPSSSQFDHDKFARTKSKNDFWGQIRRTVNGQPVSEEHIGMIVDAIREGLDLQQHDIVLDLACGNGALSNRLTSLCSGLHGVDFSEFLINVAKSNFEVPPDYTFELRDVVEYLENSTGPERFTKALCYGSFSYIPEEGAYKSLSLLHDRYPNIRQVFIGNLPDYDRRALFYTRSTPPDDEYKNNTSSIGIWRTRKEFSQMAKDAGWKIEFTQMPEEFYASSYRYDVILER